jgi:hypothetical protein
LAAILDDGVVAGECAGLLYEKVCGGGAGGDKVIAEGRGGDEVYVDVVGRLELRICGAELGWEGWGEGGEGGEVLLGEEGDGRVEDWVEEGLEVLPDLEHVVGDEDAEAWGSWFRRGYGGCV